MMQRKTRDQRGGIWGVGPQQGGPQQRGPQQASPQQGQPARRCHLQQAAVPNGQHYHNVHDTLD